jgi:hypothetical protein
MAKSSDHMIMIFLINGELLIWEDYSVAFIGEGFNFGEFKSKGLHKKHAVATWDLERIRLFKQHFKTGLTSQNTSHLRQKVLSNNA